jgi:hypothetical protein
MRTSLRRYSPWPGEEGNSFKSTSLMNFAATKKPLYNPPRKAGHLGLWASSGPPVFLTVYLLSTNPPPLARRP